MTTKKKGAETKMVEEKMKRTWRLKRVN